MQPELMGWPEELYYCRELEQDEQRERVQKLKKSVVSSTFVFYNITKPGFIRRISKRHPTQEKFISFYAAPLSTLSQ